MSDTPTTPPQQENKPYKGPESYQVEDAKLFFGRDEEAHQLIAKILSSRFALFHAQSGAGKTSLLNTLVIPSLEAKGWTPVRVLPQNDPIAAAWHATLLYVLPPPQAEVVAIERALAALKGDREDLTLGGLLERYDQLPVRDQRKRNLIAPLDLSVLQDRRETWGSGKVTPFFCRLLRTSTDIESFSDHLRALQWGSDVERSRIGVEEKTSVRNSCAY